MILPRQYARWPGRRMIEADGHRIGIITEVYADDPTAAWALVRLGRFSGRRRVVPIDRARSTQDGIVVPFTLGIVQHAPQIERGAPSPQEAERLRRHYDAVADEPGVAI